jgi:hypothetical protein
VFLQRATLNMNQLTQLAVVCKTGTNRRDKNSKLNFSSLIERRRVFENRVLRRILGLRGPR